jgi:FkbM family methyltransferase
MGYKEKNMEYVHAMGYNGLVAQRLNHIVDVVDFSKINTILDIGSWHLNQSLEFLHIFPNAKVYAFEPNPESAKLCRQKATSLPFPHNHRVSVIEVALSDKDGEISFYPLDTTQTSSTNHGMSSTLKLKDGMSGSWHNDVWVQKEIKVKAQTLDGWCSMTGVCPDLLWVDVQGAEYNMFMGAKETLRQHVKVVLTEVGIVPYYEGHTTKPQIDSLLKEELGFVEVDSAFEMADPYEANTIYINPNL